MRETFIVADAYMFTVLRWSPRVGIDLSKRSNVEAYLDRVAARPKVREAMSSRLSDTSRLGFSCGIAGMIMTPSIKEGAILRKTMAGRLR